MIVDIDPTVYFYHGGESPENRLRWISPSDTDVYAAAFTASFGTNETEGFCRCNPPWTGSPPNCVYACGKARYSVAALNVSGAMVGEAQCEECLTGSTCDELVSSIRTLPLASGYWRASWKSRSVKQCPRSELCSGGSDSLDYCVENHRGPFCRLCSDKYFIQGDKCMACDDATAHSPASIALLVAAAISVFTLAAYRLSTAFRKRTERIPWRSVIVKGKVLVIFFQTALMIPNAYGIPYPSIYLGTSHARIFMLHRFMFAFTQQQGCSTCSSS